MFVLLAMQMPHVYKKMAKISVNATMDLLEMEEQSAMVGEYLQTVSNLESSTAVCF